MLMAVISGMASAVYLRSDGVDGGIVFCLGTESNSILHIRFHRYGRSILCPSGDHGNAANPPPILIKPLIDQSCDMREEMVVAFCSNDIFVQDEFPCVFQVDDLLYI